MSCLVVVDWLVAVVVVIVALVVAVGLKWVGRLGRSFADDDVPLANTAAAFAPKACH